jgi:apolipoprotein N-acyltransferase
LALFWGAGFALAALASGRERLGALVVCWTLAEFLRAFVFTGFPWGLLAYVWSETPIFQWLAWVGPHGLGLISVAVGLLPMAFARRWIGGVVMLAGFGLMWGAGGLRLPDGPTGNQGVVVRLVQPNAPQDVKWDPEFVSMIFKRGLALSQGDGAKADVVIWPETALPFRLGENPLAMQAVVDAVGGAQFIGGIMRRDGGAIYNTLIHLNASGDLVAQYDKHHLVPFGEYVPLADFAAKFGIHGMAANDGIGFAAGAGTQLISVRGLPTYLPMICYEAIFPGLAQSNEGRPDWLLHLTNDAWFGNFSGPQQHLVQARARAIEQALPVARAANTGVSAMVDSYGRIVAAIPLNAAGFLDVALPKGGDVTTYSRWGEAIWLVLAALWALGVVFVHRCRVAAK